MDLPYLQSKFNPPLVRRQAVARPGLLTRLDTIFDSATRLTLISAPAGYGKTSLLGMWLDAVGKRPGVQFAWLTLEAYDDDPFRFWNYVLGSLRTVRAASSADSAAGQRVAPGMRSRALLQPGQPVPVDALISYLLDDLDSVADQVVWIFDDFQSIQSPEIHKSLAFLIDHLPRHVHLVIATRTDPFLPLPRLRTRNELLELRLSDLAFNLAESSLFFNQTMGLNVVDEFMDKIVRRTAGWVAGMQFAALSLRTYALRERNDLEPWLLSFSQGNQNLVDYYNQEVLSGLKTEERDFLLAIAILERLNGDLCQAVTGRADSRALLEQFERDNFFLIALDSGRTWLQFHPLFRDLLLRQSKTAFTASDWIALHSRAATWFENNGWTDEAVRHALAARAYEQAGRILQTVGIAQILSGGAASIFALGREFPASFLDDHPELAILMVWALLAMAQFERVETDANRIEASLDRCPLDEADCKVLRGHLAAIRATTAFNARKIEASIAQANAALDLLPETEGVARSVVLLALADGLFMEGYFEPARLRYLETARLARQVGNRIVEINSYGVAGRILSMQGKLKLAEAEFQRALDAADQAGLRDLSTVGIPEDGMAELYLEWNDLDRARQWNRKSLEHFRRWGHVGLTLQSMLIEIQILQATGQMDEAFERIHNAWVLASQQNVASTLAWIETAQARLDWENGRAESALQALLAAGILQAGSQPETPFLPTADLPPMIVNRYPTGLWLLDRMGETAVVFKWLDDWLERCETAGYGRQVVRLLIIRALLLDRHGNTPAAFEALARALELAEPEGMLRTFLDEGPALVSLLETWLKQTHSTGRVIVYAQTLLARAAVPAPVPPPALPAASLLSDREREVLRLVAAGLTNDEIARELVVSLNTVKTHLKRIYDKLGVNDRRAAVRQVFP
jgi:LuxR family maltose regulon positive regulatory protein